MIKFEPDEEAFHAPHLGEVGSDLFGLKSFPH
jgi:hypothetical protein